MQYYMLREKNNQRLAKGTGPTVFGSDKEYHRTTPPKLYSLGSAKGVRTLEGRFGLELEIIPVTITCGEPI